MSTVGSGPDVILVPGLASSASVWDGTVAALDGQYTFHIVQVAGFAGAPARGNDENENVLDDLATDLARYSGQFETSPSLVGHSLGGLAALKAALEPSAKFDRLVIVDVLPFFSVLMDPEATAESIAPVSAMMKAAMLAQSDDVFSLRQAEALSALTKSKSDVARALKWSVESDRSVMAQAMSEVLVTDLRSEISTISVPTTVIYAKDDAIPNMAVVEAFYHDLYSVLPGAKLIPVDGAFHFIMWDQSAAFVAAMQAGLVAQTGQSVK
ncbi:MAG: alpha/beta hydrolase [Pseudomonadota bacterium]